MNKNLAKKAIILNILAIAIVATLMITATFAWFQMSDDSTTDQTVTVGSFIINLNDDNTVTGASDIAFANAFPMTTEYAQTHSAALKNAYKFEVKNEGTINAMFRFDVPTELNTNKLAKFTRYKIRHAATSDTVAALAWATGDGQFLVDGAAENTSLQEALDTLLVSSDTGTTTGKIDAGSSIWFEIIVWIDSAATYGSGTDQLTANDTFSFALTMRAIQSEGGATWMPIQP